MLIAMLGIPACIDLGEISKTILMRAEGNMFLTLHGCYLVPHWVSVRYELPVLKETELFHVCLLSNRNGTNQSWGVL